MLITVLSRHTNVVILEPLAVDRTRQITYTLTNGGGDDPEALAEAKRDAEFVGNDRRGRRTAPSCRRSSAASAAAPTMPSPSASSKAPSCTSTRR